MNRYVLAENLYVLPTPGGVFHAVSTPSRTPVQRLILSLLSQPSTPRLTLIGIKAWSGLQESEQAQDLLHRAQEMRWLQGLETARDCPTGTLEDLLPNLLVHLGNKSKVVLADHQGFYLSSVGFPHEVAEELSALSAELASLHERRSGLLLNNMGLNSSAWAVVDASGGSRLGFWPLYIGDQRFVLAIAGLPRFNQPAFVNLVWLLSLRYGEQAMPPSRTVTGGIA